MVPSRGGKSDAPFDLNRLRPEERELWERDFTDPLPPNEGMVTRVWSFGYICMLELYGTPDAVSEYLQEHDPENLMRQYLENVRSARREGRL